MVGRNFNRQYAVFFQQLRDRARRLPSEDIVDEEGLLVSSQIKFLAHSRDVWDDGLPEIIHMNRFV